MRKLAYLALIPVIFLTLMPPVPWTIPLTDKVGWQWFIILFGFAGFYTLFLKINPFIKVISILAFINCFYSFCPYISHFAYIELVACIYLLTALTYIEDWNVVFNALWCVLFINLLLFFMQYIHKDNLLNFGLMANNCSLSVGNNMQAKSMLIVLSALLLQDRRIKIKDGVAFVTICGLITLCIYYFFAHHVWFNTIHYRGVVWLESIRLTLSHPFQGYGIGMFKVLFNTLGSPNIGMARAEGNWLNAHNFFVQLFFETGFIGLTSILCYLLSLYEEHRHSLRVIAGMTLVLFTLCVHFPDRQIQVVPLLILFLAYIERKEVYGTTESTQSTGNSQPCTWTS